MQYDKDLLSQHVELFLAARKILLAIDGVVEIKKDKITSYAYNGSGLCHMRTMPHGIDIGFLKGAQLSDKYSLLHGKGKRMRVLSLEKIVLHELNYYLLEATSRNS
ncbi:MAG: DUF1801 domain-containing protein [Oceanospirillaceae bacterium]|nr:DUF1801 domain-containing protein [Oceanospirillaceae bacterium]